MESKKHLLVFESQNGTVLTIETDYLTELSDQKWFSAFISDAVMLEMKSRPAQSQQPSMQQQQEVYAQAQQQFAQQQQRTIQQDPYASSVSPAMQRPVPPAPVRQEVPKPEYLSITPQQMNETAWARMTNEQKLEWGRYYNIKLG
jgi:hypothetical protein